MRRFLIGCSGAIVFITIYLLILPAVAVAAVCTVVPAEFGYRLLRHSERKGRRDPTWMTVAGLLIWAAAIVQCSHMMRAGSLDYIMVYVCLALCTLGGTLSLDVDQDGVRLTSQDVVRHELVQQIVNAYDAYYASVQPDARP